MEYSINAAASVDELCHQIKCHSLVSHQPTQLAGVVVTFKNVAIPALRGLKTIHNPKYSWSRTCLHSLKTSRTSLNVSHKQISDINHDHMISCDSSLQSPRILPRWLPDVKVMESFHEALENRLPFATDMPDDSALSVLCEHVLNSINTRMTTQQLLCPPLCTSHL